MEIRIGKFRWHNPVTPELARKIIAVIPLSKQELVVDVPPEDDPADEMLDLRCSSY